VTVGVAGLGLIGGSFVKAYHEAGERVLAWNRTRSVLDFALLEGSADGELNEETIKECDLILVALYPEAAIGFISRMAPYINKESFVIDCCGTKRVVCAACFPIAERYGFTYIGGHPMAGTQYSGYKYAKATLYKGQPMVLVPPVFDDIAMLSKAEELLAPALFGRFSVTTAEKHDEMIAFTSQLAHVVSNAYIKSPTAGLHKGFSAGSYRDMTRVAWLNPGMWAELFLENRDFLGRELDTIIKALGEYRKAMEEGDRETLISLLDEGRRRKEEVDG
jgi:prephenate dehydrogenase